MKAGPLPRAAALAAVALCACSRPPASPPADERGDAPSGGPGEQDEPPLLVDATRASGIDFVHARGGAGNREPAETMGGGVGLIDREGDGDLDVYLVQSGPVRTPGDGEPRGGAENALFDNDGAGRFTRLPGAAGAADAGYGMGCAVGDADGDGRDDLLVLDWGPNALYRNEGGTFANATEAAGLGAEEDEWSVSAAFFDAEGDGDLDLYVVNYVRYAPGTYLDSRLNPRAPAGFPVYPTPDVFPAAQDRFFVNESERGGGPRFRDGAQEAGLMLAVPGKGLGVVPTDIDLDGFADLYVANDGTPNFLLHNRGDGTFAARGRELGVAFSEAGLSEAGMGVDSGDADGDLDLDLFVTNLDDETNSLYLNQVRDASGTFRDRTRASGLHEPSRSLLGFGTVFADFDLDGDLDLFVCNGHIFDNVRTLYEERTHPQPNQLFLNDGSGRFAVANDRLGPGVREPSVSRGCALGDLDGDGLPDLVIGNNGEPVQVLLSAADASRAARVRLAGPAGNPRGLGAVLWIEPVEGAVCLRRVESARAYASASAPEVVVAAPAGLAAVEVLWPGGRRERYEGLDGARDVELRHGAGR